jgi:putative restriction endonuclease
MDLRNTFEDDSWDSPFFKVLPHNDTGAASGHQGGIVIPIELRDYFPSLEGEISQLFPTVAHRIKAQLFVDGTYIGIANPRYQFQTWGAKRRPESRLTDELGPMRNLATVGDILIFQRNIDDLLLYRLMLITKGSGFFPRIKDLVSTRRWGRLQDIPMGNKDLAAAVQEQDFLESKPFSLLEENPRFLITKTMNIARSVVFRDTVIRIYSKKCAVCGEGLVTPNNNFEVQAAHIVSRSAHGSDDARNGICLCSKHHWAFDRGLFGVDEKRRIFVPQKIRSMEQNQSISTLHGHSILEAAETKLRADNRAFQWHMQEIVLAP